MTPQKTLRVDALIIGAGPAGLMAGTQLAQRAKTAIIVEKNSLPGRKLLISGKGRCNLTNATDDPGDFLDHFSPTGKFLRNCLHRFSPEDLMTWFSNQGVSLTVERGKRVFPTTNQSRTILDCLMDVCKAGSVELLTKADATTVTKTGNLFTVTTNQGGSFSAPSLLIATGGLSYPQTGSTGFGFTIAEQLGHTIVPLKPALMGLEINDPVIRSWQGITLENISCRLGKKSSRTTEKFGDLVFTHYGVSGPIILDLSGTAFDMLAKNSPLTLSIDFKPALSYEVLEKRLLREREDASVHTALHLARTLLPKKMAPGFLEKLKLSPDKKMHQSTRQERTRLVQGLKNFRCNITATRPIAEAVVTRGGIAINEINPQTMESQRVPGLFFAGEIIDVDAQTGGYNMQAAFSTGFAAGTAM